MKLTIAQALGTVLNIQIAPVENHVYKTSEDWFIIKDPTGETLHDKILGKVNEMTLDQAVWKAVEMANFKDECHFAIFPMGSGREDYYMAIEREMLRQEASPEFQGKKMWELLGNDPRELVTAIMEQMRDCAQALISPTHFQGAMIRTGVLVIASLQWISDWIGRLRVRHAHLASTQQEPPKVIEMPKVNPSSSEPTPALFGPTGLSVVEPSERKDRDVARCKHGVPFADACADCARQEEQAEDAQRKKVEAEDADIESYVEKQGEDAQEENN